MKIIFVLLVVGAFLIFRKKNNESSEVFEEEETQDDDVNTPQTLASLKQKLDELGKKQFIMPIEMFQLANGFVEHENKEEVVNTLTSDKYANHSSLFVRRVAIIALRRLKIYDDPRVVGMITEKLSDPIEWVAYDAAWYFKEARINNEEVVNKLTELAGDKLEMSDEELKSIADANLSDAAIRMQIEAAEALKSIRS